MKYISHKDLTWENGMLTGEAQRHFKGDQIPKQITVRGRFYNAQFRRKPGARDRDGNVLHYEYRCIDQHPRLKPLVLRITESAEDEPLPVEE